MHRPVVVTGALAALGVGVVQFRHGIVPLLDTVTYWSGAEAVSRGDFFSTTLAPSFSNFSAVQFLERGGTLPFVDFPVGYPLLAGSLGVIIGVRRAMQALVLAALVAITVGVVAGDPRRNSDGASRWYRSGALALTGVLVTLSPAVRLVTQGALSEPLFGATVLWLVIALARYRRGGTWTGIPVLVVAASLLRFLGAPLAVLAGWERYQRTGRRVDAMFWTAGMMTPAALDIGLASAAGGGHSAGWRGIDRLDVETFVRSIGGWFDGRQGDIRRTYFTADGPSWWSWPVALLWIALVTVALVTTVRPRIRRRVRLPDETALALSAAGIMSIGLVAGIMGFDALVIADNRLMLPSGILTIAAVIWWLVASTDRVRANAVHGGIIRGVVPVAIILWAVTAVRPWQATDMFSDQRHDSPLARTVSELSTSATDPVSIVITNDADRVHWETAVPAAYAPMPVKPLTGEIVDEVPLYRELPCALRRFGGAVIISNQATFSAVNRDLLDAEVTRGTLERTNDGETTVYRATSTACAEGSE